MRKSFPDHLPRQPVVIEAPTNCTCCGSDRIVKMGKDNPVGKAINYMLEGTGRWEAFIAFFDDGCLCLTNNAAERALRGIALGRKSWLFVGSERGGDRAAFMYTLTAYSPTESDG